MVTVGIDIGSLNTKAVVLQDNKIISWSLVPTGESTSEAAQAALDDVLKKSELSNKVNHVAATGAGKKEATCANSQATEIICEAKGARFLNPEVGGLIDIGAESCRVVKCDPDGSVADFALNDKCASGTGIFLDAMAKALEVDVKDMGPLSLQSTVDVNITSTCVVFAESEVVSQIHRRVNKVDILKGIHKSIAARVLGQTNRLQLDGDILLAGGVAQNIGVVTCLQEMMKSKLIVPDNPQLLGALGAAIIAKEKVEQAC
ncbi:MAG: acyl-CoA dehydratase activase [Chloroflexota bacterium]|nr:acyl-CoA dehydratase activase [Chloroflexota bacterium]